MYFILKGRFQLSRGNELFTYTSFQLFKFVSLMWGSLFCVLSFLWSLFSTPWAGFSLWLYFDLPEFHIHTQFCSYSGSSVTSRVEMGEAGLEMTFPFIWSQRIGTVGAVPGLANWTWAKGAAFLGPASTLSPIPPPRPSLTHTLSGWRWHGESPGHRGLPGPFFKTALQAPRPSKDL